MQGRYSASGRFIIYFVWSGLEGWDAPDALIIEDETNNVIRVIEPAKLVAPEWSKRQDAWALGDEGQWVLDQLEAGKTYDELCRERQEGA